MFFFSRNRKLAERARAVHGTGCMVCGFDFAQVYGEVGLGYIECHHLDPLSERSDHHWNQDLVTNVQRVSVVCSNCHRMIHRRRPAYSLNEVMGFLGGALVPFQGAPAEPTTRELR
jgi:5-methylcytosine-specific restriction protein A